MMEAILSKSKTNTNTNTTMRRSYSHLSLSKLLDSDDEESPDGTIRRATIGESVDDVVRIRTGLLRSNTLNRVSVTNWAETVEADIKQFRYPETVEEVIDLVKAHPKIRCSGALHSCAPLVASEGIILSLTKLDKIISIDPTTRIVKMQSGVRIHTLCEALAPYGLAVGTLGTIDWQTISGAVMTGTHGGALTVPSLHDYIKSYTLVKPDGEIIKVERDTQLNLFRAMAPSMGVFGAVIELEMEAVPLQILEARMISIPSSDLIDRFDDVMKSNKYARVVVYPSIGKATIWTANPVASREAAVANGAEDNPGYTNFRNEKEKDMLKEYLVLCNNNEFEKADDLLKHVLESQLSRLKHYVGQYNHILCLERNNGIPHADIEFNFDYNKHNEVLQAVQNYSDCNRIPYYNYEIRTTKQDDAMLSCCHGRDAMWIDFQAKADVSKKYFGEMECALKHIGYRKHWAKGLDNTDPTYLVQQFPRVAEFVKLMKSFDPKGKFRNKQAESWFEVMDTLLNKNEAEEEIIDIMNKISPELMEIQAISDEKKDAHYS